MIFTANYFWNRYIIFHSMVFKTLLHQLFYCLIWTKCLLLAGLLNLRITELTQSLWVWHEVSGGFWMLFICLCLTAMFCSRGYGAVTWQADPQLLTKNCAFKWWSWSLLLSLLSNRVTQFSFVTSFSWQKYTYLLLKTLKRDRKL